MNIYISIYFNQAYQCYNLTAAQLTLTLQRTTPKSSSTKGSDDYPESIKSQQAH